jgi:hypothetical protein
MFRLEFLSAVALASVIVWAYLRRRRALRERLQRKGLDDAAVDRIISQGRLEVEDPEGLDLDEIARAEEEFWNGEAWDPAEEDRF